MNEYNLSIIVPCYNEGLNIPILIEKIAKIDLRSMKIQVILVNNGSTDNSEEIINITLNKFQIPNIKTIKIPENKGYGYGILQGLKQAEGNLLAWTHADLQTDINDVLNAYECFKNSNKDIFVKGKRKKRRLIESFLTFGMQVFVFFVLQVWLDDINAQPKLFSRNFYEKYIKDKSPNDFSLDLYAYYVAQKNISVNVVPVFFNKRLYGESKGGSGSSFKIRFNLIKRTIKYIIDLKHKMK